MTAPTSTTPAASSISAWQAALAAEYAAAFGYGALGPKLTDPSEIQSAHSYEAAHRALAGATADRMVAAGITPVQPSASYPLPFPLTDAGSAHQLALRLETATASAWRYLISVTDTSGQLRTAAVTALTDSAVRAVRWRSAISPAAPTVAFPGI